ncbi:MAG: hypothetical protein ACI8UO_003620 [Verrucomicrobiales bacterium]|jgi:hypothetical protein
MGYQVAEFADSTEGRDELAAFLATMAKTGEHPFMCAEEDANSAIWKKRFGCWWDDNPFCAADSPKGLTLRTEDGAIVGFQGMIPQDFISGETRVPGILATTLIVDPEHRAGSTGLMLRFFRLGRKFHIVDSSVTDQLAGIMERFGAKLIERQFCAYLPLWRQLIPGFGSAKPRELGGVPGKFVSDPNEIQSVVSPPDPALTQVVSPESIRWFLTGGIAERRFRGWIDETGQLQAWTFLRETRHVGQKSWSIVGYGGGERISTQAFIRALQRHPKAAHIPRKVRLLISYVFDESDLPVGAKIRREVATRFCHILPKGLEQTPKRCLQMDGDLGWL